VTYAAASVLRDRASVAAREQRSGVSFVSELDHPNTRLVTRIVRVPSGSLEADASALRSLPGVLGVGRTGYHLHALSVTTPFFPNDPYFAGFSGSTAPLYEAAAVPGEWDKHVERLEDAFAYSQTGNGSSVHNANALGSSSVKIAIIDTGEDTSHPELASKIVYTKCFITSPSNVQSSSDFETDPQGHGTDTSGIAAAASGNGLGFTGSGGNAVLYAYRVFPTPDDSCATDSGDSQCDADTRDIAASIQDAVAQHVNVISISLGGGNCSGGNDPDPNEGAAVADAIAAGIVVVAAAGNSDTSSVSAPACDAGVIAAGATALADGSPNGSGNSNGSPSAPNEYVASYSNYGSPGKNVNSASAWGIVAPGGDPSGGTDNDDLHWVENIWTTTPFDSKFGANPNGPCTADFDNAGGTVDCRVLIAGTSMATPNVAGAAALILAVNSSYQSASAMKTLLCQTADDIDDPHEGCGRLDVYRAMATALGDPTIPSARPIP
jgi:subtilisin family serine protease